MSTKHIHLIGICGTAMASLAGMLRERGFLAMQFNSVVSTNEVQRAIVGDLERNRVNWAVLQDENSGEARTSLAHVKSTQDWDWQGAEREFRAANR